MTYSFRPQGVCSREMRVEVDDQGVIQDLQVLGGCSGNLQGIAALVRGMPAQEAILRLRGIRCGFKDTSCPDQLARNLAALLEKK
nr:TIGR03905 family TSCPD domain-containing protein [uncultured Dysosmobacter sp.]